MPTPRLVPVFFFRRPLLLVAAVLTLSGCFVPIPSVPGEAPYGGAVAGLIEGTTTRNEVVALLGEPPIQRAEGRLLIYGASRETGARILGITIVPMTIPLEEFHFLFLEFDDSNVLRSVELVIQPEGAAYYSACDSRGRCIEFIEWEITGVVPFWVSSGDVQDGDRAVISASLEQEAVARLMEPPEDGCLIYLFDLDREIQWYEAMAGKIQGSVYFALDDHPRYIDFRRSVLFAAWTVSPGQHVVRATRKDGELLAEFPIDCFPGTLLPVVAEVVPTFAGMRPQVDFALVTRGEAEEYMTSRRLVLE